MSDQVPCDIKKTRLRNPHGFWHDGIEVTCSKCGETAESFGTGPRSTKRCLAVLREKCPRRELNFYVEATEEEK